MGLRFLAAGVAALVLGAGFVSSQQREAEEASRVAAQAHEPGGTAEQNLWRILIVVGIGDTAPARWDGGVKVEDGEIHTIDGYRFTPPDRILPQGGWRVATQTVTVMPQSTLAHDSKRTEQVRIVPKGVWIQGAGSPATRLVVNIAEHTIPFQPMQLAIGSRRSFAGGLVEIQRVPPVTDLSGTELRQHDSPALSGGKDGTLWSVWGSYHDRREELNLRLWRGGRWSRLIPVGRAAEDLWNPQVAVDSEDKPWLVWAQQVEGNWDIYAMRRESHEHWGGLVRLSEGSLPDFDARVASAPDGTIYVVWQAHTGRNSQVHMRYLRQGVWSALIHVTSDRFNNWEPAVAAGPNGTAWMVWDRYTTNYDIYARSFSPSTGLSPEMRVSSSARFEAHASVAVDQANRPWIAWETGGVNWGKDLGMALGANSPGTPLGDSRRIEVVCLDANEWKAPAAFAPGDSLSAGSSGESAPQLVAATNGDIWMAFKRRYSFRVFDRSSYWESYLTRLAGARWQDPIPFPESWSRAGGRLGLTASNGRLWAFWPQETRRFPFAARPRSMRVLTGSVELGTAAGPRELRPYAPAPDESMPGGHVEEAGDVARMRDYRVTIGGTTAQVVRGDLHRHTELSQDMGGIGDGSLQELYRYMIDAAELDFGASTDHQGGGIDYWNWITLKMADLYRLEDRFVALYGYERNMPAPHGHRNIFHPGRDYRIVPFFQRISPRFLLPDTPDGELVTQNSADYGGVNEDDTRLLYEELRKSGGIAIPHTTAGANRWQDNDPKLDPVLEIYQGARDSSEHKSAPRSRNKSDFGYAWDAWKKGYRVGVIASSDHFSTHISYAMVYTPARTREAILDAIRRRHTYGATDNILLEFWLGEHFMGDDFKAATPQPIRIRARGTAEVQSVQLIRDGQYIHQFSPGTREVELTYLDQEAGRGAHWYYVRLEQRDGQLAWSSPIWVNYPSH